MKGNWFGLLFFTLLVGTFGRIVPNEDEYTLQAVEELRHMSAQTRLLSEVSKPECGVNQDKDNSIKCCIGMTWMKQHRTICIDVTFNSTKLQLDFTLFFDGVEIFTHALTVGEVCGPLPGLLKRLNICAHAYYVNVDTNPPRTSFDACFVVKLGGFFHLRLNCIRLDKEGKFSQNSNIEPETKGVLMLNLEEGNLKFDFNNPIPKDIMDKLEKGWNLFGKEIATDLVDKAGKQITDAADKAKDQLTDAAGKAKESAQGLLDKTGKQISEGAKQVQKELDKATAKAKEAVVGEINKVTAAVGSLGDKISGWFG